DRTRCDIWFLVARECRPIMFDDVPETRVAGEVLIIQSENDAGDAVSADESHVTVNRKEHSWRGIVGRHSRNYPPMPETMAKQSLLHATGRNLGRRKRQRMGLT